MDQLPPIALPAEKVRELRGLEADRLPQLFEVPPPAAVVPGFVQDLDDRRLRRRQIEFPAAKRDMAIVGIVAELYRIGGRFTRRSCTLRKLIGVLGKPPRKPGTLVGISFGSKISTFRSVRPAAVRVLRYWSYLTSSLS